MRRQKVVQKGWLLRVSADLAQPGPGPMLASVGISGAELTTPGGAMGRELLAGEPLLTATRLRSLRLL